MGSSSGRTIKERDGKQFIFPIADGVEIIPGTLVALDATGKAVPATATAGLTVVGIAEYMPSLAEDQVCARRGCFAFDAVTGADAPTLADIGKPVFAADTVSLARVNTGNRPQAGILMAVDSDGCWVKI